MKEQKFNYESNILLCDLDAFFASVEQRDHPEYRGKPLIVGGSAEARGVVATCSYEAREYGVRSAMPMKRAIKLCPQAIVVPPNISYYQKVSAQVREIMERFTPDIEVVSIDEAYLLFPAGEGLEKAAKIRQAVAEELQLPISIGVSSNKLLAKIACERAKPNNLKALWPEDIEEELWPLPVSVLPGVGPATKKKLQQRGINTVGDLAATPPDSLAKLLGKIGFSLHQFALGMDDRQITPKRQIKSISEETTFPYDLTDRETVMAVLMELAEDVGYRLRRESLRAKTISLKLRFSDFRTITRDVTLAEATNSDKVIYQKASQLFKRWKFSALALVT